MLDFRANRADIVISLTSIQTYSLDINIPDLIKSVLANGL